MSNVFQRVADTLTQKNTPGYLDACRELMQSIRLPAPSSLSDLSEKIANEISNHAANLFANNEVSANDTVKLFFSWCEQYGDHMVALLNELRLVNKPEPKETILQFFLDGQNGAKIKNGDRSQLNNDWVNSNLLIQVVNAVSTLYPELAVSLPAELTSLKPFAIVQRSIERFNTELKANPFYFKIICERPWFSLGKNKNENTGANAYFLTEDFYSVYKGKLTEFLTSVENGKESVLAMLQQLEHGLNDINNNLAAAIKTVNLSALSDDKKPIVIGMGLWDASEYVFKLYAHFSMLDKIALTNPDLLPAEITAVVTKGLRRMRETMPDLQEMVELCYRGDFPANNRNQLVEDLFQNTILQLYFQRDIAEAVHGMKSHVWQLSHSLIS